MEHLSNASGPADPLPVDNVVAMQLLDLFRDPDRDVDRIVEIISQDPKLTAETLKRCNNGIYGSSERITDLFEAVSRLGFYQLYDIIAASAVAHKALPTTAIPRAPESFWPADGPANSPGSLE